MSGHKSTSDPPSPASDDARHRDVLRTVLEAGADIVQHLAVSIETTPDEKAQPYDRLARAIRCTIVLARHIADKAAYPNAAPVSASEAEIARRIEARRRLARDIAIRHRPEQLGTFGETLNDPAFDARIATTSVDDIIRDLQRDLTRPTDQAKANLDQDDPERDDLDDAPAPIGRKH